MIDPKKLRHEITEVITGWASRGFVVDPAHVEKLQTQARETQSFVESLLAQRHALSDTIARKKRALESTAQEKEQVLELKEKIEKAEQEAAVAAALWQEFISNCPNIPNPGVPIGKSEDDNKIISQHGHIKRAQGRDHLDILEACGQALSHEAAELSGARFSVLKGTAAKIHRALIQYMLDFHSAQGFEEFYVPYLVGQEALYGTGQLPKFEDDLFKVTGGSRPLYLIPTAEVPLTNLLKDKIIPAENLPLRYMAHTPCFRSEAGSYGKDTRGLFRQHQFEKVELVHFVTPDKAKAELEFLVNHVSALLLSLELPHQIVELCTGDLGFSSAQTFDLEVWLPGQQRYREISSCSHFTDFQARRIKARYRHKTDGSQKASPEILHTINGSGVAIGRAFIALVENHGHPDGCDIPAALAPYLGGQSFIKWA